MSVCPDPECKADIKRVKTNLYGDGPNGDRGVYGALNRKVGYPAFSFFVGLAFLVLGWVLLHESRISKTETIVTTLCEDVRALKTQSMESTKKILDAIEKLEK